MLHERSSRMTPNDILLRPWSVCYSSIIRDTSSCKYRDSELENVLKVRNIAYSILNGQTLPLRAQGVKQKRKWKDCKSQEGWRHQTNSFFQTQQDWCTYEPTETVAACTGLHRYKWDGVSVLRGEVDMNPHSEPRRCHHWQLLTKDTISFLQWCFTGYTNHT